MEKSLATMQNVMVADGTAQSVVLWENEIGKLDLDKSYQLENVVVHAFKHLSFSEGITISYTCMLKTLLN